jgi:hypothetical protein
MKYLLLMFILVGCKSRQDNYSVVNDKPIQESHYMMQCEDVGNWMRRCENKEVICYNTEDTRAGIRCKFKETK